MIPLIKMNLADGISKGNDDQAFWGLTAMTAAQRNLPIFTPHLLLSSLQKASSKT